MKRALFFAALVVAFCLDAICVYTAWAYFIVGRDLQPGPFWLEPTTVLVAMAFASVGALGAVVFMRGRPALRIAIVAGPALLMLLLLALVVVVYPDG